MKKYKCRSCEREFDVFGWEETNTTFYPQVQFPIDFTEPNVHVNVFTNYSTITTTKIPICPFCKSKEIEEANK